MWNKVRTRVGALTLLAGVLTIGGTAGVVAAASPASDQQPAGTVFVVPSDAPAATTTDAPVVEVPAVATPAPVAPPVAEAPATTVNTVTEPTSQAPAAPVVADRESIGTTGANGNYTPAPPRVNPGEPPVGNLGSSGGGGVTPLEGEPGYTGPVLEPQG